MMIETNPIQQTDATPGPGAHAGLLAWLAANDVDYELHEHPLAVTAMATARAEHVDPRLFAKVVAVEGSGGDRALVVLDAPDRLDVAKAALALGADRVRLLTEPELLALAPDMEVGALPAVGALVGLPVLADLAVREAPTLTFPAGTHRHAVMVDRVAWERAAAIRYADLAVDVDQGPAWAR